MTRMILTFVASDAPLSPMHLERATDIITAAGLLVQGETAWLAAEKAADLPISGRPNDTIMADLRAMLAADRIDVFVSDPQNRRKRLLLADMDSTIVAEETLDELAAFAGLKDQVAEITAKAMNGELDFHGAIRERVALLKGLSTDALRDTLAATIVNPGAKTLVATMKAHGAQCVLVSGGFTVFTHAVAQDVGFDHDHGNILGVDGDALSGTVEDPILDKQAKVAFLEQYCADLQLHADDCMTIGDGANDIPMLEKAGFGVGYRPKPAVAQAVVNLILYGDLSAVLYAQGYTKAEIVS